MVTIPHLIRILNILVRTAKQFIGLAEAEIDRLNTEMKEQKPVS